MVVHCRVAGILLASEPSLGASAINVRGGILNIRGFLPLTEEHWQALMEMGVEMEVEVEVGVEMAYWKPF
jgi:hypothetical protein